MRRAGTLKNRSRTSTVVPGGCASGAGSLSTPSSADTEVASGASPVLDTTFIRDTEAMLGSASPRKPSVRTDSRSSMRPILLVAWRASASGSSAAAMPAPSSRTRTSSAPPPSTSISIEREPASRLFSTSSLITDAGRSTTSPAAIWWMSCSGRTRISRRFPTRNRAGSATVAMV